MLAHEGSGASCNVVEKSGISGDDLGGVPNINSTAQCCAVCSRVALPVYFPCAKTRTAGHDINHTQDRF